MNSYFYSKRLKKIYTFDNRTNGNMGPAYFYNKVLNKQNNFGPSFKKTDLSIYLLHSNDTDSSVLKNISDKVSSIKGYNLGFQKISINNNYLEIINNIKKDPNHKFLIIDEKINNNFENLFIPYKICDLTNLNENIYSYIFNYLFNLIEKKYIIH